MPDKQEIGSTMEITKTLITNSCSKSKFGDTTYDIYVSLVKPRKKREYVATYKGKAFVVPNSTEVYSQKAG